MVGLTDFLRSCGLSCLQARRMSHGWRMKRIKRNGFGFLAVLFNPFIVIHLNREIWSVIDLIVGIFMIVSVFVLKLVNKLDNN